LITASRSKTHWTIGKRLLLKETEKEKSSRLLQQGPKHFSCKECIVGAVFAVEAIIKKKV